MRYASRDPGTHVLHPGRPTSPELDAAAAAMAVAAAVHPPRSHSPRWDLPAGTASAQRHELAAKLQEKTSMDNDRRNLMQRFESYASTQQDTYSGRPLSVRSSLPPTPPQQIGEDKDEPLRSPSLFSDIYHSAVASPSLFVGSPIHLTGPPTPDTTPPRRDRLTVSRRNIARHPSQTDSFSTFVTARETMHSQTSDRSQALMVPSVASGSLEASRQQSLTPSSLTALTPTEEDTRVATPVPQPGTSRLRHTKKASPESKPRSRNKHDPSEVASGMADRHLQLVADSRDRLAELPSSSSPSPQRKPRHRRRAGSAATATPSSQSLLEQAAQDTAASHDVLYSHLMDEKSKRLSAHSGSSTVVEAMVVITPPKPQRNLRHAGRNLAFRGVSSNHGASRRSSSDSYDSLSEHQLRHHRSPLPGRGFGAGRLANSEIPQRAVSDSGALKRSRIRAAHDPEAVLAPLSFRGLSKPAKRLSTFNTRAIMPELEHLALSSDENDDDDDVPMHYGFENVHQGRKPKPQLNRDVSKQNQGDSDERRRVSAPAQTPPTAVTFAAVETRDPHVRKDSVQVVENKTPVQASPRSKLIGDGGLLASPPHGPVSSRRGSLEPPTEHGHKRYPSLSYTPLSELSQWSDRTHNAEVVTATAINIYPHHNESVLVIQQHTNATGEGMTVGSKPMAFPPEKEEQLPSFQAIVHEGTPPPKTVTDRDRTVDSPLLNPRAAPEPPVFKFIPPTPNDEEDRQLGAEATDVRPFSMNATEALPTRKLSLREKAAVQGSSILDAIFLRQPSIRRRYVVSSNVDESQRRNLHPFWRPRGFWDDFDSDEEDCADEEPLEAGDVEPLPRGGDTSNVEVTPRRIGSNRLTFPRKMSTRLPGFRGSGGFLIGNSLGIGRHGTNNRRPYVSPPSNLQQTKERQERQSPSVPRYGTVVMRSAMSSDSLSRRSGRVMKAYRVPGVGTVHVHGLHKIKESIRRVRETRAERAAEKRREQLRGMIGMRISHVA